MDGEEFAKARKVLAKTQEETAHLLGVSVKTVRSYEQRWRKVPAHVERQLYFLLSRRRGRGQAGKACWVVKRCPTKTKKKCPAWEFQAGRLCWFINGTICCGEARVTWEDKMRQCRACEVLHAATGDWRTEAAGE